MDYLSLDSKSLARLFVKNPKSLAASIRAWIELDEFTGEFTKEWLDKRNNGLLLIHESVKLAKDFSAFIAKFSNEAPVLNYWLSDNADYLSADQCDQWYYDLRQYLTFFEKYLDVGLGKTPKEKKPRASKNDIRKFDFYEKARENSPGITFEEVANQWNKRFKNEEQTEQGMRQAVNRGKKFKQWQCDNL